MSKFASFVGRTVVRLVIAASVAVLLGAVVIPRLGKATPYTITSGSMEPTYGVGSLVVTRYIDPEELKVGDVVTIQLESGRRMFVTHRIVDIQQALDGQPRFVTKGDANSTNDADVRRAIQIRGKVWYSMPLVGYASEVLTGPQRQALAMVAAACLVAYAVLMFYRAARERRALTGTTHGSDAANDSAPIVVTSDGDSSRETSHTSSGPRRRRHPRRIPHHVR